MEAVAAVGVAAAAVQFLDYSVKILTLCKEIRDSPSGSTKANEELKTSINKLTAMQKDLRKGSSTTSSTYRQLIRAVQDCAVVAAELLQLLEHIRDQSRMSAGVMRAAWQAMKKRKTIERLQERLADCQTKYHLALTTDMRDEVLRLLEDQGKGTKSIHDLVMQRFDFTRGQIDALDKNITQLAGAAQRQLSTLGHHQQKASAGLRRGQRDLNRNIDSQFSKLSISSAQQEFLDRLYFSDMFARQESLKKNLPGTYEWVFDTTPSSSSSSFDDDTDEGSDIADDDDDEDSQVDEQLRSRIRDWLRQINGTSAFWVSGKPGSGKSSLMSFVMSDERTSDCLQVWTGGRLPHIFSFFFWKPGSRLQRTMSGLRRSLIWQLCKARPSIISQLISRDATVLNSPWTEAKLTDILRSALSANRSDPLFFIIDGLDECEDNHIDMLDELQGLKTYPYTKICISSRPEQAFCQRLEALPSIRLQDLNYRDISKYALTKLGVGDGRTKELARDVAVKSEGVFLWAVLVCNSLRSGLLAEDDDRTLLRRLNAYPKGLDDLFDSMFANLEEVHYKSLAFYFYAAQQPEFSVALAVASQPIQKIESLEHFGAMCTREVTRITEQSKGLLQITHLRQRNIVDTHAWSLRDVRTGSISPLPLHSNSSRLVEEHLDQCIRFVHRSAYDYILQATSANRLAWLNSPRDDIIRKMLTGALWLAQYGPTHHTAAEQLGITSGLGRISRTLHAEDIVKAGKNWLCHELEKYGDSIHLWMFAVKDDNRVNQQAARSGVETYFPQDSKLPLWLYWYDVLGIYPDFVASHSCRLWHRDDTYLNIVALLDSWSRNRIRPPYSRVIDSAMSSVANEFLRRQLPCTKVTVCKKQRQYRFMMAKPNERRTFISWEALNRCNEATCVLELHHTAMRIAVDQDYYEPDGTSTGALSLGQPKQTMQLLGHEKSMDLDILKAFCALVHDWQISCGWPKYAQGIPLPLQLSVPLLYKYPPTSRYLNVAEINRLILCRPEMRLRLSCFARRGPGRLTRARMQPIPIVPVVSYWLSSATTSVLFMSSGSKSERSTGVKFVGSRAELSSCVDLVMGDIWDDAEDQLTAWEQLYLRACVKFYFSHFWRQNRDEWLSVEALERW